MEERRRKKRNQEIFLLSRFSYVSEASTSNLIKQCKTDKLCSIDNSETQALLTVFESDSFWADVSNSYSFVYTALSNKTTFTFAGQKGRTLKVNTISIHDTSNNQTLIKSGDLKNDSFNAYCLCNDSTSYGSQYYAFEFQTLFSQIIVSQSVQIVPGRQYNVTFWVDRAISWNLKNRFIVRRSSASKMTVFSFFFVFLHLF